MLDAQSVRTGRRVIGATAPESVLAAAHVTQRVPLRGALREEVVDPIVHLVAVQGEHVMAIRLPAEQRRIG